MDLNGPAPTSILKQHKIQQIEEQLFQKNVHQLKRSILANVQPNASITVNNNMAPALTEPLSPTNKLSASTSSASPRPTIISNFLITNSTTTTSNSNTFIGLHNNNNSANNNNNNNNNNTSSLTVSTIDNNIKKLLPINNIKKDINNSYQRRSTRGFGAFQTAFEETILKKANTFVGGGSSEIDKKSTKIKLIKSNNTSEIIQSKTAKSPKQSSGIEHNLALSNGPDLLLPSSSSTVTIVCSSLSELSSAAETDKQQMGPMCDTQASAANSSKVAATASPTVQIDHDDDNSHHHNHDKELQNLTATATIDANYQTNNTNQLINDIEEALNKLHNKEQQKQKDILLKFDELQHMDLQNSENITNQQEQQNAEDELCRIDDGKNSADIELSHEIISTTTETTVTASESDIFDETFTESTQQEPQITQTNELAPLTPTHRSPPRTPTSSSQQSQQQNTPISSITPQSTSSVGMGLQKDFIKDAAEMDQVLGDMDLLQVLKGFETTSGGGEALCDLAGSLGLFNDVDVMSYEEIVAPQIKTIDTDEVRNDIEKRQQQMQRKCDFLLRRLRKIQARSMGKHTSEEISGLFEWTNRLIRRKDHEQLPDICYDEDKHRPVTQAAMRGLLRRIDSVALAQHSSPPNGLVASAVINSGQKKKNKSTIFMGRANSISNYNSQASGLHTTSKAPVVIQKYDIKSTEEIGHVAGLLQTEIREVQCAFDSDVTASSSGGESADEMVTYNNQVQQSLSISKRAGWRWARDRSSIASRWTWLCAQISDLEYRIRQHNELYIQIKKNKGSVTFEKNPELPSTTTLDSSMSGSGGGNGVNGYRPAAGIGNKLTLDDNMDGNTSVVGNESGPPNGAFDQMLGACRTRPFQRTGFRKRKLLQTANVHTVSKKAARPSTVKCGCQWPLHPCALCTGRPDPTAPRDLPDTMMESERVALLDPGFHPVLSFAEDVGNSIHIEATLQMPDWQNRIIRNSSKLTSKNSLVSLQKSNNNSREDRASSLSSSASKKYRNLQKNNRKQQDSLSGPGGRPPGALSANKLKSKIRKNSEYHTAFSTSSSYNKKHRKLSSTVTGVTLLSSGGGGSNGSGSGSAGTNMNGFQNAFAESLANLNCDNLDGGAANGMYPRSKNSSPIPTNTTGHSSGVGGGSSGGGNSGAACSNSGSYKYERMMERRNRNSYDIDNIVIPYSVAAATRVEILPYKEIPTPKWRIIEDEDENLDEPNESLSVTSTEKTVQKSEDDDKFVCPKEINCPSSDNKSNNKNNESNLPATPVATVELLPPPSPLVPSTSETTTPPPASPPPPGTSSEPIVNKVSDDCTSAVISDETSKISLKTTDSKVDIPDNPEPSFIEDISEEAISLRHERALLEERRKFSTFLKFPWSTRSRANRRLDSRAESSGANTPDPTSPAPNTPSVGGGDQESIPSPAAPSTPHIPMETPDGVEAIHHCNPSTSFPPVNNIYYPVGRRNERKRTVSAKKDRDNIRSGGGGGVDDIRRSSTPDPREIIQPFEPLQFPLADDVYETMLKMMPNYHVLMDECLKLSTDCNNIDSQLVNDLKLNEYSISNNNNITSNSSSRKNSISSTSAAAAAANLADLNSSTSIFSIPNQDVFSHSFNNQSNNGGGQQRADLLGLDSVDQQLMLLEDSDTDSAESGVPDEDPNDPEWKEPQ